MERVTSDVFASNKSAPYLTKPKCNKNEKLLQYFNNKILFKPAGSFQK